MATRQELERALSNPNVRKMLDVIANAEGVKHGYNTIFGNERSDDLKAHPNVKKEFTQTDGKKNSTTAAGRYQFLKGTWDSVSKKYGLTDFSPKNQDLAAVALILGRGALGDVIKGDFTKAVGKLGGEWASLPSSNYAQPKKSWKDIQAMVGEIKPPNRKPAQNRINQLVTAYDKQAKASTAKNQINPQQKQNRVNNLLAAFDKQNPDRQAAPAGLPDFDENGVIREDQPQQPKPQQAPLSTMDKIIGGGEAALTVGTGMIGGAIGQAAGGLHGIAESVVDGTFGTQQGAQNAVNRATQFSNALTYEPNTAGGRRAVGAVGEFIEDTGLDTLPPVLGGGVGTATATLGRASVPVATTAAREVAQAAKPVVAQVVEQAKRPVAAVTEAAKSTVNKVGEATGLRSADAGGSMGAAAVPIETTRQAMFNEFNVPSTTAQVSRNPTDLAEMHNLARKGGEAGQIIQDHLNNQQQALGTAIDDMIYSKGATTTNAAEVGERINDVLGTQFKVERAAVNKKYQAVRESEGAQTKVDLSNEPKWAEDDLKAADERGIQLDNQSTLDLINENIDLETTAIYRDAKRAAVRLGVADEVEGRLVPKPKGQEPNVNQVEEWRKLINDLGSNSDDGDIRIKTRLKKLIDNSLDNSGSNAFREVRKEYSQFKQSWEGRAVLSDLVAMKRGANSGDRKIIDENIVNRIIKPTTSQKDLEFVKKKILQSEGGEQAWTDLQASIIDKIRNEAFSGAQDAQGNNALLASKMEKVVKTLDGTTQRLDTLLGKQEAEKIRNAAELAKIIKTVPEGTGVNWSNTGTLIATMMDATIGTVFTGIPVPVPVTLALQEAVKHMKGKKEVARAHAIIKQFEKPVGSSGKF
ncbi:TPA: glycoside hydrolase family 104 protein [Acinetobacter baumannii]|uniref:glycoside hydrolase family 24 protein n=1 Tax=Acinetobacter baumannii TaxID=470 RepID=UPI001EF3E658|nr:glycoside hydrolase family 104 protein [Acinetobacter baumannii]MCF4632817.1 glycoside hydrolase family 104 protein [Acinetobacter baumannii]HCQ9667029.1 glycoside hydrolase family 104 protein [Acinetobacter baumannii]